MKNFELISKFPEVVAAVLSDGSGSLLQCTGNIDGETAGAVNAFTLQLLGHAGDLLGLGSLERTAVVGPARACLISAYGEEVLGVYSDPGRPLSAIEKRIDSTLRR